MRIRWWKMVVATILTLLALLWLIGGLYVPRVRAALLACVHDRVAG